MTNHLWIKEWPTEILKLETTKLKHGPDGQGGPGPCPPDCEKCLIIAELKRRDAQTLALANNGHIHEDNGQPCTKCFADARKAIGLPQQTFQLTVVRFHEAVDCMNCRKPVYTQHKLNVLTMPDGHEYELCLACVGTLGALATEFSTVSQKIHHGDLQMVVLGKPGGETNQ